MAMQLDQIVPFGRTGDEYRRMFALSDRDHAGTIVGVGDGPASFNAEQTARGGTVVSVDPVYRFTAGEIESRFHAVVDGIIGQVRATPDDWVWSCHASPERLRAARELALQRFVADYPGGRAVGRYLVGELPDLPLADASFDLALCSHLLFLYSDQLDYAFHRAAVQELLRVASEVRIFPLLTLANAPSPHLEPLLAELAAAGIAASVETVAYELQRGGNRMLRLRRASAAGRIPDVLPGA